MELFFSNIQQLLRNNENVKINFFLQKGRPIVKNLPELNEYYNELCRLI